jgi:hypothetical protein
MSLAAGVSRRTSRQLWRKVRRGLFSERAILLPAGVFFPQALQFFIHMLVLALLLLTLGTMLLPAPGVKRVVMHAQGTSGLGHGLL